MLPRFHIHDISTVLHYLGVLVVATGVLMLVPFAVGIAFGESSSAVDFLVGSAACVMVGALLRLFRPARLDRRRSLLLCGLAWVFISVMAAIPLYLSGDFSTFLDAVFDAVSAFTTTGVSVADDIDRLSYAQSTWRALMALVGAQAIIIIGLYLGFFGSGGYSARENAKARQESTLHSLRDTARYVILIGGSIVLVGLVVIAAICVIHGFAIRDAVINGFWLSSSAYSTGSFIPHSSSLIFYHSTWLDAFICIIMMLGALSFSVYALVIRGKARLAYSSTETRLYLLWITLLVAAVAVVQCRQGLYESVSSLFDHGTFMIIAAATTSGMQTVYPAQMGGTFASGAFILIMVAMFVGSSSNSTGGGLKIYRVQRLLHWFGHQIKRSLLPNSVKTNIRYNHFGAKFMQPDDAQLAMVITVLYIIAAMLGTVSFVAHGYDALGSIGESISYVTNSGITAGITSADMASDLKIVAMVLMWAGRLEFVALIAVFAGIAISLRPTRANIPAGVVRTRRAQRSEARSAFLRRVFKRKGRGDDTHAAGVLIALLVAFAIVAAPSAWAAGGGAEVAASDLPELSLDVGYRASTVRELVSATERLDLDHVEVVGEVMGPPTREGSGHLWVNIKGVPASVPGGTDGDEGYMIGVFVSDEQASQIEHWGGYASRGDIVRVRGVFNLACNGHSGELDLHAASLGVEAAGSEAKVPVSTGHLLWALLMFALGALVLGIEDLLWGSQRTRRVK